MKFSAMVRNGNYAVEIIDQTELMFRLMDRHSRAHDIADLINGHCITRRLFSGNTIVTASLETFATK